MLVTATTTPGMEELAAAEGIKLLGHTDTLPVSRAPDDLPGVVSWGYQGSWSPHAWLGGGPLRGCRTLYHAYADARPLDWDGRTLDSLVAAVEENDLAWLEKAESFRVSCERVGLHSFRSPDVERTVGTVLHQRYGTPGQMDGYAIHIGLEVRNDRALLGYRLTRRKGFDRRYHWRYHPRITLRTPVAYLMLHDSGFVDRPGALYDPCCGSGTILLEAASVAAERGHSVELRGSDRESAAVEGARNNATANAAVFSVEQIDVNALRPRLAPASLDYIITNPPYGARLGRGIDYHLLYQSLLSIAGYALADGGRLALLVERRGGAFEDVRAHFPRLTDLCDREVEIGGLRPRLLVLQRVARYS